MTPSAARWYCINSLDVATLCASEADARHVATLSNRDYPRHAPHRAALLGDVRAERDRCAALCDSHSADHWHDYKDTASQFRGDPITQGMSDGAAACAAAIRNLGDAE